MKMRGPGEARPRRQIIKAGAGVSRRDRDWNRDRPEETARELAREDLREIVRRLALGERPGIAFEPILKNR